MLYEAFLLKIEKVKGTSYNLAVRIREELYLPDLAMEIYPQQYCHIYNRSNNKEIVFKSEENYEFFLYNYQKYVSDKVETLAYCLVPNIFIFLILCSRRKKQSLIIILEDC
jgi:hypothetical protein